MLLSVGLWHMLHIDSHEDFAQDLQGLSSAIQTLKQLPNASDELKASLQCLIHL